MKIQFKTAYFNAKLFILIHTILLSSCGTNPTRIYTNASSGTLKAYKAKQEYRGIDTSAVYVSGTFGRGNHKNLGDFPADKKTFFEASIHKSVTRKYYNMFYGASGGFGIYNFKADPLTDELEPFGKKTFYTLRPSAGINFNLPIKNVDWRILGLEIAYNYESGPFQEKLQEIKDADLQGYFINNQRSFFHYDFSSEIVFKLKNLNAITLGLFYGDVINKNDAIRHSSYVGFIIAYKHKRWTFSLLSQGAKYDSSVRYGLSYQLF